MKDLQLITEGSRLSRSCLYQIDGSLYRFLYSDPFVRSDKPRYVFKPLVGQRKRTNKVLNTRKLKLGVYEVVGFRPSQLSICGNHIQMELQLDL